MRCMDVCAYICMIIICYAGYYIYVRFIQKRIVFSSSADIKIIFVNEFKLKVNSQYVNLFK